MCGYVPLTRHITVKCVSGKTKFVTNIGNEFEPADIVLNCAQL